LTPHTGRRATNGLYGQAVKRAYDQAFFVWLLNIEDVYGLSKRIAWPARVDAKILVSEMKMKK
jgi:peptide/nickel transport system substrate-binding protein